MFFGIKSRVIGFMAFVQLEEQLATGNELGGNTLFRLRVQHIIRPIDLTGVRGLEDLVFPRDISLLGAVLPHQKRFAVVCGI